MGTVMGVGLAVGMGVDMDKGLGKGMANNKPARNRERQAEHTWQERTDVVGRILATAFRRIRAGEIDPPSSWKKAPIRTTFRLRFISS